MHNLIAKRPLNLHYLLVIHNANQDFFLFTPGMLVISGLSDLKFS